jgi:isopenicillin N synthase-like dioxygenase
MDSGVPQLSLADCTGTGPRAREVFSGELMRGFQRYGFIILHDHPVSPALLDEAYDLSAALFAQGEEIKRRYVGGARGYAPFRTEHAKNRTERDLKEFWQIGPERANRDTWAGDGLDGTEPHNLWPESPAGFKQTFLALFDALQDTGRIILEALTPGLGLPPGFFDPLVRDRNSILRLLHYPPLVANVDSGAMRSAAHEDINLITLLPAPRGPGLELLDRNSLWLPVNAERNDLIVDSGEMLARMTNDMIPATTHRVVNPTESSLSRYSMPFFMHPNTDVILNCLASCVGTGPKYADITAGALLEQRLREIGLTESPK